MIRKYNYKLETGVAGTDDDNIAAVLYAINRMEMKATFTSSDVKKLDDALGELFFMITDAKVHMSRFLKSFGDKTNAPAADTVLQALDDAMQAVRESKTEPADTVKMSALFPLIYKKLLETVPSILALDAQAVGRE